MERLYFTFGSDPKFPFGREDYIVILGSGRKDCLDEFRRLYPPRDSYNLLNCADYYTQKSWDARTGRYYKGVEPKKVIITDNAYGQRPKGFDPLWFYVPQGHVIAFLKLCENPQGVENEFRFHITWTLYALGSGEMERAETHLMSFKDDPKEIYECLADAIPDVLRTIYGSPYLEAVILHKEA